MLLCLVALAIARSLLGVGMLVVGFIVGWWVVRISVSVRGQPLSARQNVTGFASQKEAAQLSARRK